MDQKIPAPEDSLITLREYGRVEVKLKEMLDAYGIKRNTLARAIGCRFEVINRWCKNDLQEIDTDTLAKICCYFNCSVGDIVEYRKCDHTLPTEIE